MAHTNKSSINAGLNNNEVDDQLIHSLVQISDANIAAKQFNNDYATNSNHYDDMSLKGLGGTAVDLVQNAATSVIGGLGLGLNALSHYPKMMLIREALPIAKAYLLMGLAIFLPFVLVFSGYSLRAVGLVMVGMFAMQFLDCIWAIAYFMDNKMLEAINAGNYGKFIGFVAHPQTNAVLDLCSSVLYLGLPLLWIGMLSWAGIVIGGAMNNFTTSLTQPAAAAGMAGGSAVKQVGTKMAKK